MVSGNGTIDKRETPLTQVSQYSIKVGKRLQIDFELPNSIDSLQNGQKVNVSITTSKPKKAHKLLTLRGEVYEIEKTKSGTNYVIFFSGLQGSIIAKRRIPGIKVKKPIYLSITK